MECMKQTIIDTDKDNYKDLKELRLGGGGIEICNALIERLKTKKSNRT